VKVLAEQPADHLQRAIDGFVQIEHLGSNGLLAGEGQALSGQVGGAFAEYDAGRDRNFDRWLRCGVCYLMRQSAAGGP
jgi:hypothetical protein